MKKLLKIENDVSVVAGGDYSSGVLNKEIGKPSLFKKPIAVLGQLSMEGLEFIKLATEFNQLELGPIFLIKNHKTQIIP